MSYPPTLSTDYQRRRIALDRACRTTLGGARVWRIVKAISQLLVISLGFWFGVSGAIPPEFAFAGILAAYLGTEWVENVLVTLGEKKLAVSLISDDDETDTDSEPAGGDSGNGMMRDERQR